MTDRLDLRALPLRRPRTARQLLEDRARDVGAAVRAVARARRDLRLLQQRLGGLRGAERPLDEEAARASSSARRSRVAGGLALALVAVLVGGAGLLLGVLARGALRPRRRRAPDPTGPPREAGRTPRAPASPASIPPIPSATCAGCSPRRAGPALRHRGSRVRPPREGRAEVHASSRRTTPGTCAWTSCRVLPQLGRDGPRHRRRRHAAPGLRVRPLRGPADRHPVHDRVASARSACVCRSSTPTSPTAAPTRSRRNAPIEGGAIRRRRPPRDRGRPRPLQALRAVRGLPAERRRARGERARARSGT